MAHKVLKIGSIVGGGLLAAGGGAVGSHFAEPILEKNFYPQRLEAEAKLKKTVDFKNNQVTSQKKRIDGLTKQVLEKEKQLSEKISLIEENKRQISSLNSKSTEKQQEINRVNGEKIRVENEFNPLNERVNLKKEDILTQNYVDMDLLNINIQEIKWKSFDGEWAKFDLVRFDGTSATVRVNKDKLVNYEQKAKEIKDKGINFQINEGFDDWNKEIILGTYESDYAWVTTEQSRIRSFWKDEVKHTISLNTFFQEKFLKDAFKVLVVIDYLDFPPFIHDIHNTSEKSLKFDSQYNISKNFSEKRSWGWSEFTSGGKHKTPLFGVNRFKTKEDFIKYWIKTTIEFIRYGRVDLFDMFNPMFLSKHYQLNSNG